MILFLLLQFLDIHDSGLKFGLNISEQTLQAGHLAVGDVDSAESVPKSGELVSKALEDGN